MTVQVSVALTLTVAGFLLVASLLSVYGQSPPVATSNITSVTIRFLGAESAVSRLSPERTLRANTLLKRLRNVHGVDAVALTAYDLLDRAYVRSWFKTPTTALNPRMPVIMQAVTADYYRIVQPQLVAGRLPTDMELVSDSPVIVVSGSVASNYWPDASAIGQILTDAETNRTFTVVGIVKDVRWYSWDEDALPTVYGPYGLLARLGSGVFLIRASAGISGVGHDAVRAISETDPLVRTDRVAPLRGLFVDSVRPRRFQAWLFGSFAAASLLVVAIGIFGQLAVSTARRTREVGIRMTCGATRGAIVGLIFREQLAPVLAGLLAGGIAAAWAVRFLASFLYQITSFDLRVWVGAIGLILAVAAAGALVPALRASRVDPTQALRLE